MKTVRYITILLIVAAAAAAVVWWKTSPEPVDRVQTDAARVAEIRTMLRLCTVDVYEDFPIKASIGSRHFVARATLNVSISFDLDSLVTSSAGDTLVVILPPEVVDLHESTEPGAYKVIDTWNDRLFGSAGFTAAEENRIKAKAAEGYRRRIYAKGYVRRARAEAAASLASLLRASTGRPVKVIDPSPEGYR